MNIIYLDNSATTKPYTEVADCVYNCMLNNYGNPSSLHIAGIEAERLLKASRDIIAKSIGANRDEVFFTSGGTESNNIAIAGGVSANKRNGNRIITTKTEHASVSAVFDNLKTQGFDVVYLPVDENGVIDIEFFKNAINKDTCFISCMLVNNEIGTIQPIKQLTKIAKKINPDVVFHTDAVQAYMKVPVDVNALGCDIMSVSSHKIHGPKGMGALYVKKGVKIKSIVFGGGQEKALRSGTENVPFAAGFARAVEINLENLTNNIIKLKKLKEILYYGLKDIDNVKINTGMSEIFAPHILNVSFKGIRSEIILHSLESEGIMVSSGSACSSNKPQKSATLTAIGLRDEYIDSAVRISLSHTNTEDEIISAVEIIKNIVNTLKRTAGKKN